MNENEIVYLAIPYTWNPEQSFIITNEIAAKLMLEGYVVFSPISHSHPISKNMTTDLKFNQEFWMKQDLPMLRKSSKVFFVVIGDNGMSLIDDSDGCQSEKEEAQKYNIPIEFIKYELKK